jgi:hypothetical protein
MRKVGHILIALLVFASSTFAIAPMAFCQMEVEEPVSCCEEPVKQDRHCDSSDTACPICSYDLCDIDPTPAKPAVSPIDTDIDFVTIPIVTLAHDHVSVVSAPLPPPIDSGPPLYLLDCVFRI